MKNIVETKNAPAAIGPYSQAVSLSGFIFTSGQLPINPQTGEFPQGGIKEQTKQSLLNIKAILEASGSSMQKVIKTTVFLKNMEDFAQMNEVYKEMFGEDSFPARSAVEVARLPKGALVEIEAIANV